MRTNNGGRLGNFNVLAFIFIIFTFSLPIVSSLAQVAEFDSAIAWKDQWRKEGQLVTLQISRGNPIRIFVVGKEEVKIDPSTMSLTVRRLNPYPAKLLSVDKFNNYFVVSDSEEFKKSKEIEITTDVKGTAETFRFEIKQDVP